MIRNVAYAVLALAVSISAADAKGRHHVRHDGLTRGQYLERKMPFGKAIDGPSLFDPPAFLAPLFSGARRAAVGTYTTVVDSAAAAAGVPARIAHAVVRQESGYNARLRGRAGEYGLGQIKCGTAREVGFRGSCSSLFDPETNLTYSMRYLRLALDRGGQGCAGITLYNTGVYARPHCSHYGRAVLAKV